MELTTNYFLIDHDAFSFCFEQSQYSELTVTVRRIFSALQVTCREIQQFCESHRKPALHSCTLILLCDFLNYDNQPFVASFAVLIVAFAVLPKSKAYIAVSALPRDGNSRSEGQE